MNCHQHIHPENATKKSIKLDWTTILWATILWTKNNALFLQKIKTYEQALCTCIE